MQAAIKMALYGPPGSGKTFTSLLIAEGLAKHTGKRVAYVDTERGTDFYAKAVKERKVHPEAFDFDALYSRSIMEVLRSCKSLGDDYGVVIIDSITHIWEACINGYAGKKTKEGTIPFHAWGKIKKPYKELMQWVLSAQQHVLLLGRQGNDWKESPETGELVNLGYKMKAEGETPYEPHILMRMEAVRSPKELVPTITAITEKDRSGVLTGKAFQNPTFEAIAKPVLELLGGTQAAVDGEEATQADVEAIAQQDAERASASAEKKRELIARFQLASTPEEVKQVGKELTAKVKKEMLNEDVAELREVYLKRSEEVAA